MIFKLKNTNKNTQIFHTFNKKNNIFSKIIPLHSFYTKTTNNPQFQNLKNTLIKSTTPSKKFNKLNPNFQQKNTKYPKHLITLIQINQP